MAAEPISGTRRRIGSRFGLGTVRVRTTLIATAVVAVALVLGSILLVSTLVARLTDSIQIAAQAQADQLADAISTSGPAVVLSEDDDRLVQILDADGVVLRSSSSALEQTGIPYVEPGAFREVRLAFDDDAYLAVATVAADGQNPQDARGNYVVVVAHALDAVAESAAALTTLLAIGVPILVVLLALLIWRVVGRALAPVEAIRREVDSVSATELHRRVPQPAAADEVGRLAETMNRMLSRLEDSRTRQQQFVADASHELRSPLASIRAHAEIAQSHPERADAVDLAQNVLAEGIRMQQLVEDLLVLTRLDEAATRLREPVDLDDIVFDEVARIRGRTKVSVDSTEVSAGRVPGDAALMRRVVANLLDNAVRHALDTVRVVLRETGDDVVLRVEDDGAGVPEEHRGNVFGRFVRLDEARARDAGGAGLGLAIVAEVVSGHAGTVRLTEPSGGGASFEVRLPRLRD